MLQRFVIVVEFVDACLYGIDAAVQGRLLPGAFVGLTDQAAEWRILKAGQTVRKKDAGQRKGDKDNCAPQVFC